MIRNVTLILMLLSPLRVSAEDSLSGLWMARQEFASGRSQALIIHNQDGTWTADWAGHRLTVQRHGDDLSFSAASGERFTGTLAENGTIQGHWIQRASRLDRNVFATTVRLDRRGETWIGSIRPHPDTATFYISLGADNSAWMINPERNLGVFQAVTRYTRDEDEVTLLGQFRGRGREQTMLSGRYLPEESVLHLRYPWRGGGYEFQRVEPQDAWGFAPRPAVALTQLALPPVLDDGWATGSLEAVRIDARAIQRLVDTRLSALPKGPYDLSVHALLIARHGRLVVEEYFHGYHRELAHDSRSASKSVTALLAAAVRQDGTGLDWDQPVYATLNEAAWLEREPERADITLRHLLNMNSGLDCDDRNPDSAANEDVLWDNADSLDFYQHFLGVKQIHPPGKVAAYCTAGSNLAGGVIEAVADEPLLSLIQRLLAEPLEIQDYAVPVPPDGHPYMGGGIRWRPRDFLKFPQLILNQGRWNDRRVLSPDDARRLVTPEVKIDGERDYGYLWWTVDYPYGEGTVRAHFMAGNGGQIAMAVPELELAIAFNAGNYSDKAMRLIQNELIPEFILPAVSR